MARFARPVSLRSATPAAAPHAMEPDDAGDEDYMGDLSHFLPPSPSSPSRSLGRRKQPPAQERGQGHGQAKRAKGVPWQERRRRDRERKQRQEDERTMAGLAEAIPESNVGFRLLKQMGYDPAAGGGGAEPVGIEIRRSRAGLGAEPAVAVAPPPPPQQPSAEVAEGERRRVEEIESGVAPDGSRRGRRASPLQQPSVTVAEGERRRVEEMAVELRARQSTQWRSRRVVWDYRKAEAALAQLENREVEPPPPEGEEKEKTEEEEEVITEEDLQIILAKLRDEHYYCLYCGCKYESAEALANECPGPNEDDH
ncbi:hypothetical protein E2562_001695 [Oryza meyeriana var. granulata]|uniref:DUF4187 domain-containing protein n=1 Tax=Oryza meyeriana var. granulata TaxID=110450 RepID=A0A6G1CE27_9ORYZ|nr:hypothetical protein E2562_001695 [Oryza meyeriana var. granulata]KAF0898014.1 hypothetical protein E2562_001695 [Oryza meyeriana var. granulata]